MPDQPRPGLAGYQIVCPIVDPATTFLAMQTEARAQLLDELDAGGWDLAGPITYTRGRRFFVATTTVQARADPDDARPWESRDAYACDMFDLRAA